MQISKTFWLVAQRKRRTEIKRLPERTCYIIEPFSLRTFNATHSQKLPVRGNKLIYQIDKLIPPSTHGCVAQQPSSPDPRFSMPVVLLAQPRSANAWLALPFPMGIAVKQGSATSCPACNMSPVPAKSISHRIQRQTHGIAAVTNFLIAHF